MSDPSGQREQAWVIAIDGPSGSGKSTIAADLAAQLKVPWLSSGALYRAVTRLALDRFGAAPRAGQVIAMARSVRWQFTGARVCADQRELTPTLHCAEVDGLVAQISAIPAIRGEINRVLRARVGTGRWVVEGRDIGTEVFPDAAVKVFVDAAPAIRAQRRARQRGSVNSPSGGQQIAADLAERDRRDRQKPVGSLRPAAGAHCFDTSHLTVAEICDNLLSIIPSKFFPE